MGGPQYTFADFCLRMQRSALPQMRALYFDNQALFRHRPDMLARAVQSLSWERGCALIGAAAMGQAVPVDAYRAALARMLAHNRKMEAGVSDHHAVRRASGLEGGGAHFGFADWRVALRVLGDAHLAYGARTPSRVYTSALRALVPTRQWEQAIRVLKLRQSTGDLSAPMVLDAAHAHATCYAWADALRLIRIGHAFAPKFFSLEAADPRNPYSLMPPDAGAGASAGEVAEERGAQQRLVLCCASVMSASPWEQALRHRLLRDVCARSLCASGSGRAGAVTVAEEYQQGILQTDQRNAAASTAALCLSALPWRRALDLLSSTPVSWTPAILGAVMRCGAPPTVLSQVQSQLPRSFLQHPETAATLAGDCVAQSDAVSALAILEQSSVPKVTPDVLSAMILQLWADGRAAEAVRAMRLGASTDCTVSPSALVCGVEAGVHCAVPWQTALSWALQLSPRSTSTASSSKAHAPPLHHRLVSCLIHHCAAQGAPRGALNVMAYAEATSRLRLQYHAEIQAVLFCGLYGRRHEAELIVTTATEKHGAEQCKALRVLLEHLFPQDAPPSKALERVQSVISKS